MTDHILAALAAFGAGLVNAIAGGGSLVTFPTLVALGMSNVIASVMNTVAVVPGYLGAAIAQRRDLEGQGARALRLLPIAAIGGTCGAVLLIATGERAFQVIVPFLILAATLLLAFGERIKKRVLAADRRERTVLVTVAIGLAAVYGGYFGAAMGVMIIAALAIGLDETLTRINALKHTVSLVVNTAALIAFIAMPSSRASISWSLVAVMAVTSLAGGWVGGMIVSRIRPIVLRWLIVILGITISIGYFVKLIRGL